MQILQKIIDIASSEKEEAIYTISCFDMHKRNKDLTDDYSNTYGYFIYCSELVKNELEEYKAVLILLNKHLKDSFTDEFDEYDANDNKYDVYEFLLERFFSEYQLYIPSKPTDRVIDLVEYHYQKKKIYSEGLEKFFTVVKKKLVKDEDGNDIMVDWIETDELNKVASEDLAKITLFQEWDSFIETMSKVKEMLENKEDVLKILKLIK